MAADPSAPILLFDSGVGGLTVLDALRDVLPQASVIYAADLAGLPYGDKSEAEIAARVAGLLGRMSERYQPRLACIACNTASTIALGMVRDVLEIPIVGTVPAIKPAAKMTRTGTIGLLGTAATIRQAYVDNLEAEFARGKLLLRHAAPGLVGAAEAKLRGQAFGNSVVEEAARALSQMARDRDNAAPIDTLVLACTHFPLLAKELQAAFGPQVRLVDGAAGIARRIAHLTKGQDFSAPASTRFVVTGQVQSAQDLLPALEKHGISDVEAF